MLKEKKLLRYISLLIDLLNREAIYGAVINEKKNIVKNLGIENKEEMPVYPEIQYKFSLRKFMAKVFAFYIAVNVPFIILDEVFDLSRNGNNWLLYLNSVTILLVIALLIIREILAKKKAKKYADDIYYEAVGKVLEQNRLDDMRVWKENQHAAELKQEIEQWQKKCDFVDETVSKACRYGDLSKEYCNIDTLAIFSEYLKDGNCDTIYECMMKYDEAERMKQSSHKINALETQISEFENAFSEAARQVSIYLRKRKEAVENLCKQQARALEDIEYNQETTNQSLMLLSLLD